MFRLFTGETQAKQRALCFSRPALTRGEFQDWQWGACAHTPWRGDAHHQAAAPGPSYLPGRGREQLGNRGQNRKGYFVANVRPLKWEFLKDDVGKYFLLVKVLKPSASPKGSGIPLSSEVLCSISQGWSRHICASQGGQSPSIPLVCGQYVHKPQRHRSPEAGGLLSGSTIAYLFSSHSK